MPNPSVHLNGITWNHSRGLLPLVATAQRFTELHPAVEITWEKRSLQAFADHDILELAKRYDLLVIDHPWAGYAVQRGVLLPLQEHLPPAYLEEQAAHSVGCSHASYAFAGSQVALAIDAAAPVAAWRPDLLERAGVELPQTWEDLLNLARRGRVVYAGVPIDILMLFYTLCSTQGQDPFIGDEWALDAGLGRQVLEQMRELRALVTPEIDDWNPIAVYEALSSRDDLAYCPCAYGYSNYARRGYSRRRLVFGDMVQVGAARLRTTLGGTGLAISSASRAVETAVEYARFIASPECQTTIYVESGGQPGHRAAWLDEGVNALTGGYFRDTLPALDRAYLRPRYPGYLYFQDRAGEVVRDYTRQGGKPGAVLGRLEQLYQESKKENRR